ncbi:hypothetical protein G4G27_15685 [Sphingomonas sp. So64.6b]|uniref:hypothetical protein n=1 Tax=Sphingomonas sp. So64.6b TaxID=2997354 RepID=UPI0016014C91|nr:hypothetical protein [Sphingomonas sp. So64.6b]QNA85277.1 hypothetical protein G4G27_15685 [Sphingomonas sp. So64.6b]
MTTKANRLLFAATAALLVMGLAACSKSAPEAPPAVNIDTPALNEPAPIPSDVPPLNEATSTIDRNATAEAPATEPATPPDEQMMDDASATGMTSRSARGEQAADPAPATPQPQ